MADNVLTLTDDEFEADVLKASLPTLVDFWAEWCAPCRALSPVVEELARNYGGRLQVGKMNIDEQPNTAGKYAVRAIPTLLIFKDGNVVDQVVGLSNKAKLEEVLAKHI
jgi:thioredoxin 1